MTPLHDANITHWHTITSKEVMQKLKTSDEGLTKKDASERLRKYGANKIQKTRIEGPFKILLRQLKNPLVFILLAATALAFFMGKMTDAAVIVSVVILNSIIGFIQEYQAGKAIQALINMHSEAVTVIRSGESIQVPAFELVPGDMVTLAEGDLVSADLRVIYSKNLQCDESALTGESVPVAKEIDPVAAAATVGDRSCLVHSGTLVTAGSGTGIVVATGSSTELGQISELLKGTKKPATPLTKSLSNISKWMTIITLCVCAALFGIGIFRGFGLLESALTAITLAVASIPEGLPAVITISSAIGVRRMARRKAIIRHLPTVETLGSTTVICSDKTGTLTRNEMTVQYIWTPEASLKVEGVGIDPTLSTQQIEEKSIHEILRAGVLCSDASLDKDQTGKWYPIGDPTEAALVVAARKFGNEEDSLREKNKRLDIIPFDSKRKYMATLVQLETGENVLYMKGAPEVILKKCGANSQVLDEIHRESRNGMRIIAFASKSMPKDHKHLIEKDLSTEFELLGIQGMIDPPRVEVEDSILACKEAGITVKMITGDHPGTAQSIAETLRIIKSDQEVTSGSMLDKLSDQEFNEIVLKTNVFARVTPEHKLKIVKALQRHGHVVAMTGDGVNDAPALKKADIGVAMGISGTAVAKEAADMIIGDDNFKSIEAAVEEGRRVYDNLIKTITFLLPTSIGQGLVILAATLFFPVTDGILLRPIQPVQALWVNLVTAIALALPLAFEAMELDVMKRQPRKPNTPILQGIIIFRIFFVSILIAAGTIALFFWEYELELQKNVSQALATSEAQTMAITSLLFFQIFYLLNCRSLHLSFFKLGIFSNPTVYLGIGALILVQIGFVHLPIMNQWFHSSPLSLQAWLVSIAIAFTIFPIIEFEKWLRRRVLKQ